MMWPMLRLIAIAVLALAAMLSACGSADSASDRSGASAGPGQNSAGVPSGPTSRDSSRSTAPARGENVPREAGAADEDPFQEQAGGEESALMRMARAYIRALDDRDGGAVCRILAPGAIRPGRLPEPRAGCGAAVSASIGHVEPGGPIWRGVRIAAIGPVQLEQQQPGTARARVTVVTRFGGGREPSVEDDLLYLRRVGRGWRVAKPSAAFYRAVGARDVPLSALAAP